MDTQPHYVCGGWEGMVVRCHEWGQKYDSFSTERFAILKSKSTAAFSQLSDESRVDSSNSKTQRVEKIDFNLVNGCLKIHIDS